SLAERMNAATGSPFKITAGTNCAALLPGAEFVVVSVEADRVARWKLDWSIPLEHGVRQVLGENGGPGGLSHALRTIPLVLEIARQAEQASPQAYLLNYTNPLSRVCLALTRYTSLKVVGLCHQLNYGYYLVARVLGWAPDIPGHFPPPALARELKDKIDLRAAGLNHDTWIQSIHEHATGQDLYPAFRARLLDFDPEFEPLSRRLHKAFGLFPASGDEHVGEYFGFAAETCGTRGYDYARHQAQGAELDARIERALREDDALAAFVDWEPVERAASVIAGIVNDWHSYEVSVDVVNQGALSGLADWAVVEVPAVIAASGVTPLRMSALPPALTAHLSQQAAIQDRVVEAAVHGDRYAALQALLLDPVSTGYAEAEKLLDELLTVHAAYLPAFRS
ncbi:MAG: alpha-glucosidase/alpha-galactosidase, partial [Chloroflexi bacterium]|nr:alpha-glucosidase/alpha-galactosidase [Chloroflexota bacterium]